jgi:lysophospholipase L1-like esterase
VSLIPFGTVAGIVILLFVMSSSGYQVITQAVFPQKAKGLTAPDSTTSSPTKTTIIDETQSKRWVSTWIASPQITDQVFEFNNQTLRQIVHTSIGGDYVRVRLSNTFGVQPITLGEVHIALSSEGAAIVPGSDRLLTFDSKRSVIMPSGSTILSDPAQLHIPAMANLAVSIFFPHPTDATTIHRQGLQTNYISPLGDFVGATIFDPTTTIQKWIILTGVDVISSNEVGAIIALGDSITDGFHSTVDGNDRWPNVLADRLFMNASLPMAVLDAGISGNRILNYGIGPSALARFDRDVLAQPGVTYLIVLEGINDIGTTHPRLGNPTENASADDIIFGLRQIIERSHEHGIRVIGCTLLPFEGAPYYTLQGELERQQVNHWIRTSGAYDAIIDFDKIMQDPNHPTRLSPLYDSGDHLHPNATGYKIMGNSIDLSLFSLH